ncbi:MAG: RNA polymerase sigma factor [Dehalococcoidales bacterium]|nr:RNA polymerase sigma factor [Dehalococcoidales bacterium]
MEEASVITLMRTGRADAFSEIVAHYQTPILRYLYRLTGDYDLAQDLAQDTFVQAYKSILKTDSELQLKAWLYKIATNNAWQQTRRRKIIAFIPFTGRHENTLKTAENQAEILGEKMEIRQALSKVPAEQRACIVLHFVEGFKYREIAATLGITEEAVRKRVARGKEIFRANYTGGKNK